MADSSMTSVSSAEARDLVGTVQRLYAGLEPAELIYNYPHMLKRDDRGAAASCFTDAASSFSSPCASSVWQDAKVLPNITPTSWDMARRVATMMSRLDQLAQRRNEAFVLPRAILMELTDIVRHGLIMALPQLHRTLGRRSNSASTTTAPKAAAAIHVDAHTSPTTYLSLHSDVAATAPVVAEQNYSSNNDLFLSQQSARAHKQEMKLRFHACISARRISMTALMEGLYTLTYVSVKLRVELVLAQLQRRLQEELTAHSLSSQSLHNHLQQHKHGSCYNNGASTSNNNLNLGVASEATESSLLGLLVTQILVDDLASVYGNMLLLMPLCSDAPMSVDRASHLMPALTRYYYQLADWVLRVEDSTLSMPAPTIPTGTPVTSTQSVSTMNAPNASASPTVGVLESSSLAFQMLTRITRVESDERRGLVTVHLHRPTVHTPWGLLFTQQGTLLDVDAIMRLQPRARELHALLAATTFGAHVIAVNDHKVPHTSIASCASLKKRSSAKTQPIDKSITITANKNMDDNSGADDANLVESRGSDDTARDELVTIDSTIMTMPGCDAARVLQSIAEHSAHRKTLQLTLRSHAFRAAVRRAALEVVFVLSPQGGEACYGQRASILMHRRAATTEWSFTLRDADRPTAHTTMSSAPHSIHTSMHTHANATNRVSLNTPSHTNATANVDSSSRSVNRVVLWQPPPSRFLSTEARDFVRRFAGRLAVYAINGVEVRSAAQGAALVQAVETVLIDLIALPARRGSMDDHTSSNTWLLSSTAARGMTNALNTKQATLESPAMNANSGDATGGTVRSIAERDANDENMNSCIECNEVNKSSTTNTVQDSSSSSSRIGHLGKSVHSGGLNSIRETLSSRHSAEVEPHRYGDSSHTNDDKTDAVLTEETKHNTHASGVPDVAITAAEGAVVTSQLMSQLASMSTSAESLLHGWPDTSATKISPTSLLNSATTTKTNIEHDSANKTRKKKAMDAKNDSNDYVSDKKNNSCSVAKEASVPASHDVEQGGRQRRHCAAVGTALAHGKSRKSTESALPTQSISSTVAGNLVEKHPSRIDDGSNACRNNTNERVNDERESTDMPKSATKKRCTLANNVELVSLSEESMTLRRNSLEKPWGLPIECSSSAAAARHGLPLRLLRLPEPRPSCATHPFVRTFANSASTWYIAEVNGRRATDAKTMLRYMSRLKKMSIKFVRK